MPAADRLFQGQAGLLPLLLAGRSARDIAFLIERYFPGTTLVPQPIRANEHYAQRDQIAGLFGYRLWAETDRAESREGRRPGKAGCDRDLHPDGTAGLPDRPAHRAPGLYHAAGIIGEVLMAERRRLEHLVEGALDKVALAALQGLPVRGDPFGWRRSSRTPSTSATA